MLFAKKKAFIIIFLFCLSSAVVAILQTTEAKTTLPNETISLQYLLDPPQTTPPPTNYYPIVITAIISAVAITIVGLIAAALRGIFGNQRSQRKRALERKLLGQIEKANTIDELRVLRKNLAEEKAKGALDKEQFDFLIGRINQRSEEVLDNQ